MQCHIRICDVKGIGAHFDFFNEIEMPTFSKGTMYVVSTANTFLVTAFLSANNWNCSEQGSTESRLCVIEAKQRAAAPGHG